MPYIILLPFILLMTYLAGQNGLWVLALLMGTSYLLGMIINYIFEN